jgi:hypothetical protein
MKQKPAKAYIYIRECVFDDIISPSAVMIYPGSEKIHSPKYKFDKSIKESFYHKTKLLTLYCTLKEGFIAEFRK